MTAAGLRRDPRWIAMYGVGGIAFLALIAQLWYIQIASTDQYRRRADVNRVRVVFEKPQRGVIYDRAGRQLVRNVPSYTASIRPADLPKDKDVRAGVFQRLSRVIEMPADEIAKVVDETRSDPFTPVRIKSQLSRDQWLILEEQLGVLQGVVPQVTPARTYPEGAVFAHMLGYTGPVPAGQAEALFAQGYERDDSIGLNGIEAAFEDELRGTKGKKQVEVDAVGRVTNELETLVPTVPGGNLVLTIDAQLQRKATEILAAGMARSRSNQASVVAIDPRTGEVLAMVGLPAYDNNLFATGISTADYRRLSEDPWRPMVNHATAGQYQIGSTFKIVTAAAALQEKIVMPQTKINCPGSITLFGQVFRDWTATGHGNVNVREALASSCDIYFYSVSGGNPYTGLQGLKIKRLAEYARAFGFGERSGIRLPGEAAGLMPTEEWKRERKKEPWYPGDDYNVGIGQGDVLATPLQLANMMAAVANGGTLMRPRLVSAVRAVDGTTLTTFAPEIIRKLPINQEYLVAIRGGLLDVIADPKGTAYWSLRPYTFPMAGKTGTAEFVGPLDSKGNLPTHATFVGYAPLEVPEIAVAVIVYNGGEGSETAAPIAAEVMKAYLESRP